MAVPPRRGGYIAVDSAMHRALALTGQRARRPTMVALHYTHSDILGMRLYTSE